MGKPASDISTPIQVSDTKVGLVIVTPTSESLSPPKALSAPKSTSFASNCAAAAGSGVHISR